MKLIKYARVAGTAVDTYVRQALAFFGPADAGVDTPLATAVHACDSDGDSVMGRAAANGASATATSGGGVALPEFAKRLGFTIQNLSATEVLRFWYAGQANAKFEIDPRESFTLSSGTVPKDAIHVDAPAGAPVGVWVQW